MSFSCELSASSPSTHGAFSAAPDFSCCSSPDSASVDPVDVLVDVLDSGLGLTEETRLPVEVDGEAVDCAVVRPEARRSEIIQNQLDIKWPTRYFVSSHHREIKTPPEETTSDDGSLGMRITKKSFHVSCLILFLLRMFYFIHFASYMNFSYVVSRLKKFFYSPDFSLLPLSFTHDGKK